MFDRLTETGAPGGPLALRGRDLCARVMLRAGDDDTLVTITRGAVTEARRGPFVMPSWDFRLSAPGHEWAAFLAPVPAPGSHDLMAMLRRGALRLDGDLHPMMANLLYFKLLLASLRPTPETAS
ncbi:MAG: hypothetical protein ACI9ZH_000370 [Paracoccaceae bacterium]|jgi:hypothetical protein